MPPTAYGLSEADREYLKTGDAAGAYRPHEHRNRIEEKVECIPNRIEALFDDIELMATGFPEEDSGNTRAEIEVGESLQTEHYQPLYDDVGFRAWLELMGYEEHPTQQAIVEGLSYSGGRNGSKPARFGARLGEMVDYLMRWPEFGGVDHDDIVADLVWGFFHGLVFSHQLAGDVSETTIREESADLLERLSERAEEDAEYYERRPERLEDSPRVKSEWTELREEMAQQVGDIINEWTAGESRPVFSELHERPNETGDGVGGLFYDVVDYVAKRNLSAASSPSKQNAWKEFCEEHDTVDSIKVGEVITEDIVLSILQDEPLISRILIQEHLENDATEIAEKVWRGVSATSILHKIAEAEPISSKELADEIKTRDYEGSVTRLAKDLAGQDCDNRGEEVTIWTDCPILEGDATGWELTDYGRAVEHALRLVEARDETYAQPIQFKPFPVDLLNGALEECDEDIQESIGIRRKDITE